VTKGRPDVERDGSAGHGNPRPAVADERLRRMKEGDAGVYVAPAAGVGDVAAAVAFTSAWQWIAAITALVLFSVGVFTFLWAYYNAVQRSRTEEISVLQLYLLVGPATPSRVRRVMLGALAAQVLTALATALARPDGPDGGAGSSLALGFLVPMFGFGLNGLWAAYHGAFAPRAERERGDRGEVLPE
jgi:hypothetical protein